jgi:hypothetical protein
VATRGRESCSRRGAAACFNAMLVSLSLQLGNAITAASKPALASYRCLNVPVTS